MAIETKRLLMRKFEFSDAPAVLKFSMDPEVTRYTGDGGSVKSLQDAKRIISDVWHSDYQEFGYGRLALVEKKSNEVIGFCGLKYLADFKKADLGFRMRPEFWGKGYATESSKAILKYAEEKLSLLEVIGMADIENLASQNVLLKLGFVEIQKIKIDGILAKLYELKLLKTTKSEF